MTEDERAFLAQVALGWFSIDTKGRIWRHARFQGGGATSLIYLKAPRRAERSVSRRGQYLRIMFRDAGIRRKVSAHRIVWMVSNKRVIPSAMEINHRNGQKSDNRPSNLELVTRQQNTLHSIHVLGKKPKARRGEDNPASKLTEAQVVEIRALAASGELSQREIGMLFGLNQSAVSSIVLRQAWAHVQ